MQVILDLIPEAIYKSYSQRMIYLKTEDEIELMRKANRLVASALSEVAKLVKPGVTTNQLDAVAEQFIRDNGGTPTFKGVPILMGHLFQHQYAHQLMMLLFMVSQTMSL